jgi:SAM-dependent methyltransferase
MQAIHLFHRSDEEVVDSTTEREITMKRSSNMSKKGGAFAVLMVFLLIARTVAQDGASGDVKKPLPDLYPYVASDILEWCQPEAGVWVDLGAGTGGVAFAIAASEHTAVSQSTLVLLDPDAGALTKALQTGRERGLGNRLVAVVGVAEKMPFPDRSIDLVFSRGSIFFWGDQAQGIREIHRVLRPGGKAMIGGGRGSKYPQWANHELSRRRQGSQKPDSPQAKEFARLRAPETFRQWAKDAGLTDFEVVGQGALAPDDPRAGAGIWLKFTKENSK